MFEMVRPMWPGWMTTECQSRPYIWSPKQSQTLSGSIIIKMRWKDRVRKDMSSLYLPAGTGLLRRGRSGMTSVMKGWKGK